MTPERKHMLQVVALQAALYDDGHTDPWEAFVWAEKQGLVWAEPGTVSPLLPHDIPERLVDIHITKRGQEYITAWSEREMDAWIEETFGG